MQDHRTRIIVMFISNNRQAIGLDDRQIWVKSPQPAYVPKLEIYDGDDVNVAVQDKSREILQHVKRFKYKGEIAVLMDIAFPFNAVWYDCGGMNQNIELDDTYYSVSESPECFIFIHNHPQQTGLQFADISNLVTDYRLIQVVAIANCGDRQFAMVKTEKFDYIRAKAELERIDNLNIQKFDKAWLFKMEASNFGLSYITNKNWRRII